MGPTSILTGIAIKFIAKKGSDFLEKVFKGDFNKFEKKLHSTINDTREQFIKLRPSIKIDSGLTHFYESQILVEELLNYSLFEETTPEALEAALKKDSRIAPADKETIEEFLALFQSNLSKIQGLRKLEIDNTDKEKISRIYEILKSFTNSISLTIKEIDDSLKGEFHVQLSEIKECIEKFKPLTALERLNKLEERIISKGRNDDFISGQIYFLKGLCYEDVETENGTYCFIKAYKYNSSNHEFVEKACFEYLKTDDSGKALLLADDILKKDDYNHIAWLVKTVVFKGSLEQALSLLPNKVRESKLFKLRLFNWMFFKQKWDSVNLLKGLGFTSTEVLAFNLPDKITFSCKNDWHRIVVANLNSYSEANPIQKLFVDKFAKPNIQLLSLSQLCNLGRVAFEESEVKGKYAPITFYSYYFEFLCNPNIALNTDKLLSAYINIKKPLLSNLMTLTQILISDNKADLALDYINEYKSLDKKERDYISLLKCSVFRVRKDLNSLKNSLKDYIVSTNAIDSDTLFNILTNIHGVFKNQQEVDLFFNDIFQSCKFKEQKIREFLTMYLDGCFYQKTPKDEFKNKLYGFEKDETLNSPKLKYFISELYYYSGFYQEARNHLNSYIDKQSANNGLFLYINCLIDDEDSDKVELIKILKWWRANVTIERRFLDSELHYRQFTQDWEEVEAISTLGSKHYPDEEHFALLNLISLSKQGLSEKIKEFAEKIREQKFRYEGNAINAAIILLREGLQQESLDILYNSAKIAANKRARQQYLSTSINYPDSYFLQLDKVVYGCYVKYISKGKTNIVEIKENSGNTDLIETLIGKKTGDTILVKEKIGLGFESASVSRIMNKYLSLFEEILAEAENPFSEISLKKFELPENCEPKELEETLVQLFGAEGSMQNKFREEQLKKYYNREISFTEVTTQAFRGNFVNAYNYLTSIHSEGFMALPSIVNRGHRFTGNEKILLDSSSVLLFFELEKELGIGLRKNLYISPYLIEFIENQIVEVQFSKNPEMSINVSLEGVKPLFYPADYNEKRKTYFSDILRWIKDNCTLIKLDRRVNFLPRLSDEANNHELIKPLIDNCLAMEDGYTLVTDDTFILRYFPHILGNICSPQHFIESFIEQDKIDTYKTFLLKSRYIGVGLNKAILRGQLENYLIGKENYYNLCLLNTVPQNNPNSLIFEETLQFLKEVFLSLQVSLEQKSRIAQTHFIHLLTGMTQNEELLRLFRFKIHTTFRLMGTSLNIALNEYDKAIQILKGNI